MAKEIERKYLIENTGFLQDIPGRKIVQGYIADRPMTTRVRILDDEVAFLTLKGPTVGLSRDEFEYVIPVEDAQALIANYCDNRVIEKTRYIVPVGAHNYEVDVFHGKLDGLVVAEVELGSEDEVAEMPEWLGAEVSLDFRFTNSYLANTHEVPKYDPVVRDGFLYLDNPGHDLLAAIIVTEAGPYSILDKVRAQTSKLLKGRSGKVLVNLVLFHGSANSLFIYDAVDGALSTATKVPHTGPESTSSTDYAQLCAKAFVTYAKHLDLSIIHRQDLKESILSGIPLSVPASNPAIDELVAQAQEPKMGYD